MGIRARRTVDRYVEVKGLAERDVTAHLALWPLRFVASGNDLATAQAQIARSYEQVLAFLKRHATDARRRICRTSRCRTPISVSASTRRHGVTETHVVRLRGFVPPC